MSEKIPYHRKASEAIKAALDTFHSLSEALRAKVHALGEKFDKTDIDTGQLTKEILAHQGAWRMVQDALAKFKEDDREKGGVGKDGIDFASARDEVLSRIARLAPKRAG